MKKKRFSEEQIIGILREHEASAKAGDLARKHGISEATLYNWKAKFGGMDVSDARKLSLLVASAVNSEGVREILGICEGAKEDKSGWSAFLRHLVDRGLKGVQLIISDACRGLPRVQPSICRKPAGNAAWCISIATSSATSLQPGFAR